MIYSEAVCIVEKDLLPQIVKLYKFDGYTFKAANKHNGGRNLVYYCEKDGIADKVVRVAIYNDRSYTDYIAETEFVRYLANNDAPVANVIESSGGLLCEEMNLNGHIFFVSAFEKAPGDNISSHAYKYRDNVPLTEYFYNTGKTIGKIHAVSKTYKTENPRVDFFSRYDRHYIDELLGERYSDFLNIIHRLFDELSELHQNTSNYGTLHFDFNEGNYNIDYLNGKITVFDFDNCLRFFYLYDLADIWVNGTGWCMYEKNRQKRREYMDSYFSCVLEGYRSETEIEAEELKKLPLFIFAVMLEGIFDEFECAKNENKNVQEDGELLYKIKCLKNNIIYYGFFDDIYNPDKPFEL